MFVGRLSELDRLNELYNEGSFHMVYIHGRRRVGKSQLVKEFISGRPALIFSPAEASEQLNLLSFSNTINRFYDIRGKDGSFASWNEAFSFITRRTGSQRLILVIEDFHILLGISSSIQTILAETIKKEFSKTGIFVILAGETKEFTERLIIRKSCLWGSQSAIIRLEEFEFAASSALLPGFGMADKIRIYACLGGNPSYMSLFDPALTFTENITRLFFRESGHLFNEPKLLLQKNLREPAIYNSILYAISKGYTKLSDIASLIKEDRTKVGKYLAHLNRIGITSKEYCFGDNPSRSRKGRYRIDNRMLRFWYGFVFEFVAEIRNGRGDYVASRVIASREFEDFINAEAFEDICLQYLNEENKNRRLPFVAKKFGKWWNPEYEFIVAESKVAKSILFSTFVRKNKIVDAEQIERLIDMKNLFTSYKHHYFLIFSDSSLSQEARKLEADYPNVSFIFI